MNILFSLSKRLQLPPRIDFLNQTPHDPGLAETVVEPDVVVDETPISIEEPAVVPEPVVEENVVEDVPVDPVVEPAVEEPAWKPAWRKADLLTFAMEHGLDVTEENTKAEIVEALTQAGV